MIVPDTHATISGLYAITGADRQRMKRWLIESGLKPMMIGQRDLWPKAEALKVIEARSHDPENGDVNKRKTLAEALKLERHNRIEEKLEKSEYMLTDNIEKMASMFISKLESIPTRFQSEFSISDKAAKRLTSLLDEARAEMLKGLPDTLKTE